MKDERKKTKDIQGRGKVALMYLIFVDEPYDHDEKNDCGFGAL